MTTIKREHNVQKRRLLALAYSLQLPKVALNCIRQNIDTLYLAGKSRKSPISKVRPESIFSIGEEISLMNFSSREGNTSYVELLLLSTLVKMSKPKVALELGTFDGCFTLQMALNSPADATIHTIDLPKGDLNVSVPIIDDDLLFMQDAKKEKRKFQNTPYASKITQHFGDTTSFDFSKFTKEGPVDFCFIDAGHSYECVKSDTERTLEVLSDRGVIAWHDFSPNTPGVYQLLHEIKENIDICHIEGTSVAIYCRNPDLQSLFNNF